MKKKRPVTALNGASLKNGMCFAANSTSDSATAALGHQGQFDVVQLFSRRTGVAPATVRTHVELFGIGGAAHG